VLVGGSTALVMTVILVVRSGGLGAFGAGDPTSYTFMEQQPANPGTPVTYSSCKPVRVEINTDSVTDPAAVKSLVLEAMGRVSAASGLQLVYVGPTDRRPRWPDPTLTIEGGAWPVLVAFADTDELSHLEGKAVGLGGSTRADINGVPRYVTGEAALETDWVNTELTRIGGKDKIRAVVMHELGHVIGLNHVDDRHEVMYPSVGVLDFGPGDLRGLAALGHGPCV
jgi:hypothetical protein